MKTIVRNTEMNRRHFAAALAGALAAAGFAKGTPPPAAAHQGDRPPPIESGPLALLLYPGFTALDLAAPQYVFSLLMGPPVLLVARTREPVLSDTGMAIVPTHTFSECPADLTLVFAPGGSAGTIAAMKDEETLAFLASRGARARFVTSVCTGSLLLGAAGLLQGYRATSHWVAREVLAAFGATPVNARVVIDRNRVTGAGVTAGVDFGLAIAAQLRGDGYARSVQLLAEYQPEPPFDAGAPERAPAETTKMLSEMFAPFVAQAREAAAQLAKREERR